MTQDESTTLNTQISEEASEWFVEFRLGDIDATGRRKFDTWIRSSPEHLRAYLEVAAIWNEGGSIGVRPDLDSDTLIALARAEGNVRSLPNLTVGNSDPVASRSSAQRISRRRLWSLAAALTAIVVGAGITLSWQLERGDLYTTTVGERRSLELQDGSSVELNSRSRIRVRFSNTQRDVELLEGQVLFNVAKDPARPFVVSSDAVRVRVVGTQFDVNRKAAGTTVTVVEGRVAVQADRHDPASQAGSSAIYLSAGEQLTVADRAASAPHRASASATTAWTQGELVFESALLTDVAEEFNRYSERRLTVADHGAQPLRLSGVFTTDSRFLIQYLRQRPDVTVEETESEVRIVRHE